MPMRRTADFAHFRQRQIVDALTVEPDFSAGDMAGRIEQTDNGESGQRFARA